MVSIGILFDIQALGGGVYGYSAYCILFQTVGSQQLTLCQLSDGDIDSKHYCIAVACNDLEKIAEIRSLLANCEIPGLMPSSSRFLAGAQVERMPLVRAAYVTGEGELMEFTPGWAKSAWNDSVLKIPADKGEISSDKVSITSNISKTLSLDKINTKTRGYSRSEAAKNGRPSGPGEFAPGEVIGQRYYVRAVHRGGMGLVYIVDSLTRLREGRSLLLALKTFQDRFLWNEEVIRRFEREALQWIGLQRHPHVVTAFLVERIEGRPYIWLEYVQGESLAERLAREKPDIALTINLAIQFTRGMSHAYERHGLFHRDIKPANCLLTQDNVLKITDFGLSKFRAELQEQTGESVFSPGSETQAGTLVGTPIYMPPEAIKGSANVDIRADIYSFGIMLYEMLAGRPVFLRENILQQHLHEKPTKPSAVNPEVPQVLDRIVLKCLEKDPDKRFFAFAEIETVLEEFGAQLSGAVPARLDDILIKDKNSRFMMAFTLMEFGRYEEAISAYQEALASYPDDAEIHNNLALCLAELDRFDDACASERRAVKLKPDYVEAWANLGGILSKLGRHEEGITACDRAIALNSNWAEGHANQGVNLSRLGRFEEAMACFERARKVDPKYWKAYLMAAETQVRWGRQPEEILASVQSALEIHPRDAGALAMAAACFKDLGKLDEAERYIKLAEKVDPDNFLVCQIRELLRKKLS